MGDRAVSNEAGTVLKGTTLEVYRFLLKSGKPVGVRGVQRALNLSSPSLAALPPHEAGRIRSVEP